ncbi:hypothetical protein [Streptomyces sp. NPDC002671]
MKIRAGGGCKSCATHGIDLAGPSNVYVITHQEWNAVKIGIGVCTGYTSRLTQRERQGWQLYQVRDYPTDAAAPDVEQAVLGRLREAGLARFLTCDIMPNGWTESCSAERVTAAEIWVMVEEETRNSQDPYAPRVGGRPRATILIDADAAAAEMRACGYEPLVPYPGRTTDRWRCRCSCGNEVAARPSSIRSGTTGCKKCPRSGGRTDAATAAVEARVATDQSKPTGRWAATAAKICPMLAHVHAHSEPS